MFFFLLLLGGPVFSLPCTVFWGVKRQKLCQKYYFPSRRSVKVSLSCFFFKGPKNFFSRLILFYTIVAYTIWWFRFYFDYSARCEIATCIFPLNFASQILSYEDLYGWTMDRIVSQVGRKSNCTFCGVFRRQALDRGAHLVRADKIVTGHNADDIAETVVMNVLRGDVARLQRCTAITTVRTNQIGFSLRWGKRCMLCSNCVCFTV